MPTARARTKRGGVTLCVIRHADAGDSLVAPERDALRSLTAKGRKQAKRLGTALLHLGLAPTSVHSSDLARARETAELALAAARGRVALVTTQALAPHASPDCIASLLAASRPGKHDVLWVVGHEPGLSRLIALLIGAEPRGIELRKGAVAIFVLGPEGVLAPAARLIGLHAPEALRAVSRGVR